MCTDCRQTTRRVGESAIPTQARSRKRLEPAANSRARSSEPFNAHFLLLSSTLSSPRMIFLGVVIFRVSLFLIDNSKEDVWCV
ncbi:hypothetical protein V6N13_024023 [Hibiscus sabdariffa]|uniref:Uncharacterized protein n=2 Tax=Hibiscus sabdariffa TaxID=183260 RepID=A0ABR2A9A9_9ROSI